MTVRRLAQMIPCPAPRPPLVRPATYAPEPRGVEPICRAPFGATNIEVTTVNNCRPPCPPQGSPRYPLPHPNCVPTSHGLSRGGIFDAPWVPGSYIDRSLPTVPQDCSRATGVPTGVTRSGVPFTASPYADPRIFPAPCPPPCTQFCPPNPMRPRPIVPQTPPPDTTPTPVDLGPPPEAVPVPIPQTPPTVPGIPGVPPGITMIPEQPPPLPRPPVVPGPAQPPPQWTPPNIQLTPTGPRLPIPPLLPTTPPLTYGTPRPTAGPARPGLNLRPAQNRAMRVPALRGFGQPPVIANTSGIFDIPRCAPPNRVPYAPSPYSDPTLVAAPCPPPSMCGFGACPPGLPPPVVRQGRPCPPPVMRAPCPPGLPPPVVMPNAPCSGYGGFRGFAGPDGLMGLR